jgi:ArsR family transcriptional regulator, arsenate/arsenite/antimonite-responsive transcriptional repressor
MESNEAVSGFGALAQVTRLSALRLLVQNEPHGLPAGEVARQLDVPQNTLSTHLSVLSHAGLITSLREGRSIIYRARLEQIQTLVLHLLRDCCNGRPELCGPLADDLMKTCSSMECC